MPNSKINRVVDKFKTLKCWVDTIISAILIFIVAAMTVLVTYQVVSRYLFNSPSAISEVLSRYGFIWLILIGSAYVFGLREHMAITYVKQKFSEKVQIYIEMFTEFSTAAFALSIMIIGGYSSAARQMWQLDSALQIPMGVIYSVIPISGGLIIFYFLYHELNLFCRLKHLK
ncbi:TRAP transporter small permease [Psychromonas hadalis]|uniref:TRAP transporter small permease n=1 Tax=Psychromonas hadalis TaxID=211669 RepID=UPI0003B51706|nr:TRAP transporter small permease [Psychromonas hadalis]